MATPRAYQLDHQADSTGKHIASTKRRILFRFGTLRPGHTRPSVDDPQHIITLSWSPTSGHTILACDGREVLLRSAQRMPPRVEGRFEESWILGEEAGVASTNEHGVHLRIIARAVNGSGSAMKGRSRNQAAGQRTAGTRSGRIRKGNRGKASARQCDLFIDGRSYFDLPLLNESNGELMAGPSADNDYDDSESHRTGSYDLGEEEEATEDGASVEEWTATGSAIAIASNDDDDNDLDSVDGFMANIDLSGSSASNENEVIDQEKASKGSSSASGDSRKASRGHRMASAKSNLQRSTARTAEKIGNSTKKGTKKFVTGTSKVLKSPIALIKRTSIDDRKGDGDSSASGDEQIINADGDVVGEELGDGTDPPSSNYRGEDSRRLNPTQFNSFSALHTTIMPPAASAGGPQQEDNGGQDRDDEEEVPEQVIAWLKEQIFHLEEEISHNADRVAAEVERSVAISEIEAQMVREQDQGEIMRLEKELNKTQEETTAQAKALQEELVLAKIEAQKLKDIAEEAEKKSNELQSDKVTAKEEISRLKVHVSTLEEALVRARTVKPPRRKGAPFVSNDQVASYLDDPKCCLCCKDATENMRDCKCGKNECYLRAHASCLIGSKHHPSPSVSHPGTPAPALPLILCGGLFNKK